MTLCCNIGPLNKKQNSNSNAEFHHFDSVLYFPWSHQKLNKIEYSKYFIVLDEGSEMEDSEFITKRQLLVVDKKSGETLIRVEHSHFKGWEDY